MYDGIVITMTKVPNVIDLKKIFISLGALDSNGCNHPDKSMIKGRHFPKINLEKAYNLMDWKF